MSLKLLPNEWQIWLRDNVAKGCSDNSILTLMLKNGFKLPVATKALEEMRLGELTLASRVEQARPRVAIERNSIVCEDGHEVRVLTHMKAPYTVYFEHVLTDLECDEMVALSDSQLKDSTVVDMALGTSVPHAHRTSTGCSFKRAESPLIDRIEQRLAFLVNWPVVQGEGLQILRYEKGGEYRAHHDYFDPAYSGSQKHVAEAGQRVGTVIMYLSDVEEGGGTSMPNIDFEVRPRKGSALFFCNVDEYGEIDPMTLHAGVPVVKGVKYIATKWLREREF